MDAEKSSPADLSPDPSSMGSEFVIGHGMLQRHTALGEVYFATIRHWAKLKSDPHAAKEDIYAADTAAEDTFSAMLMNDSEMFEHPDRAELMAGALAERTNVTADSTAQASKQPETEPVQAPTFTIIDVKNWEEARLQGFEWVANLDRPVGELTQQELAKAIAWYGHDNVVIGDTYDSINSHQPVREFGRSALYARRPAHIDNHLSMEIDPSLRPLTISMRRHDYRPPDKHNRQSLPSGQRNEDDRNEMMGRMLGLMYAGFWKKVSGT